MYFVHTILFDMFKKTVALAEVLPVGGILLLQSKKFGQQRICGIQQLHLNKITSIE